MSLEALIEGDFLLEHLQEKQDKLPSELQKLVNTVTFAIDREIKKEPNMPVITGNLQGSISIDNISDYEKRIFPDEGIAPYAIYVLKGVRGKGRVAPIDFMTGGLNNAQGEVQSAIDDFKSWLVE